MIEALTELIKIFGVPAVLMMLYGPPSALVVYFCIRDWTFTSRIIEVMTKIETLLEEQRRA